MKFNLKSTNLRKLFLIIFFPIFFWQNNIYANGYENTDSQDNLEIQKDLYLLGPGDRLGVKI